MKKTMQKLIAALLAVCCVPVTAVTANAVDLGYYWGSTSWDALDGLESINSYGIFWEYPYVYPLENAGYGEVVIARPIETTIEMRIREDADPSAAFQAA
ncbi:MAG: hypothetical protein II916_01320, partial [Oscillospiraceae bacterium]|nr:hypothetical protein [Oscillospiraceae bacterium]